MPNHVHHKMIFKNKACDAFLMQMKTETKSREFFDFDVIIPSKKPWDYEDACDKHGTKWGAYDQDTREIADGILYFQTAWSTASPVWESLAKQWPDVEIHIFYADEDIGNNLGFIRIMGGEVDVFELSNESPEKKIMILDEVHPDTEFAYCENEDFIYDSDYEEDECPDK